MERSNDTPNAAPEPSEASNARRLRLLERKLELLRQAILLVSREFVALRNAGR
jgi:hypothetical protein